MTKIASNIFKVVGTIMLLIALANIFLIFEEGSISILVFADLIVALILLFLGISMNKLEKMEDRLGKYTLMSDNLMVPLIVCKKCGRKYEADVKECPYCELKKLKGTFLEEKKE